jgi:predicted metal-dependent phosphotriesterase family hydrolase
MTLVATKNLEHTTSRRSLLRGLAGGAVAALGQGSELFAQQSAPTSGATVQTVNGAILASELGVTLMHEHIITDLRDPAERRPEDYHRDEAVRVALPHLEEVREAGCRTLVEITPIHIGRDPEALRTLAAKSGLNIICASGIYGAAEHLFIPDYALTESAEQLAERYAREFRDGIDNTGVKPGILKTGVNAATPLPEIERKLVLAAALAHLQTGLTVASHTGPGAPALEELEILDTVGVEPRHFIWVHAQTEKDHQIHRRIAKQGAWVEFDGVGPKSLDWHLECVRVMAEAGLLHRTLVSQDAGWYRPGEPGGGEFRGYAVLLAEFVPLLRANGFSAQDVDQLLVKNPAAALAG